MKQRKLFLQLKSSFDVQGHLYGKTLLTLLAQNPDNTKWLDVPLHWFCMLKALENPKSWYHYYKQCGPTDVVLKEVQLYFYPS